MTVRDALGGGAAIRRRPLLAAAAALAGSSAAAANDPWSTPLPPGVAAFPPARRRVLVPYELWHYTAGWYADPPPQQPWGHPLMGPYASDDRGVIARHAEQLAGAGVDAVLLDWSNDIGVDVRRGQGNHTILFIERAGLVLAEVFASLTRRPNIALFIGFPQDHAAPNNGKLQAKADQVHAQFVEDARFGPMMERVDGKPLLLVYADTPSSYPHGPPAWTDPRFTIRFMTGFLTEQPSLLGPGLVSRYGYWSWEDRGPQTIAVREGRAECMTVVAAWRGPGTPGRDAGRTFRAEWARARRVGPRFVFLNGWNEWKRHEQPSADVSKDIEPSTEFGTQYLDIARQEIALFKAGR